MFLASSYTQTYGPFSTISEIVVVFVEELFQNFRGERNHKQILLFQSAFVRGKELGVSRIRIEISNH
jgi:hypothetical protein